MENGGLSWGAALMDFDNNGYVDFISTSGTSVFMSIIVQFFYF